MRPFNKIFVIALPRCATVSMARALGALGICVAHLGKFQQAAQASPLDDHGNHFDLPRLSRMLQQIEGQDYRLDILQECQGLADYPACCPEVVCGLEQQFPGSLFINVRRDESIDRWLQSVEIQFVGTELLAAKSPAQPDQLGLLEVMRSFRKRTFGCETFCADQYQKAYLDYQAWVSDHFRGSRSLLEFTDPQQLDGQGYPRLCKFLQIEPEPAEKFPRNNSHSLLPAREFFQSLQRGDIQSQTGLKPEVFGI